ncbi:MAG: 30S ribosomal protein S5 [Armatimonadota bacterium]
MRKPSKEVEVDTENLEERVVRIDRTRKTVKGGRISSVRVVGAVGDKRGNVGVGVGKAREIPEAIEKAIARAKKQMIHIPLDGYTIPHRNKAKVGGAVIMLRPASRGTGIVAGGATRQILEVSGIRDILTKSLGSGNVFNRAMACFKALKTLYDPSRIAEQRGKSVKEMVGREIEDPYLKEQEEAEKREAEQARVDEEELVAALKGEEAEEEAEAEETEEAPETEETEETVAADEDTAADESQAEEVEEVGLEGLAELFAAEDVGADEEADEEWEDN